MKESNQLMSNIKKSLILIAVLGMLTLIVYDWYALWEEQRLMSREYTEE